jgi:hypothetical protein
VTEYETIAAYVFCVASIVVTLSLLFDYLRHR